MSSPSRQERLNLYLQEQNRVEELLQLGQKEETLALLERAKEEAKTKGDDDFRLLFESLQIQVLEPAHQHQVELLNQALQWEGGQGYPMEQAICLAIGRFYADNDDQETAIAWFNESLKINESDFNTLRLIGVSILKQGDAETALKWFEAALAASGNQDSFSWKEKAFAEQSSGNFEQALKSIEEAVKLRPDLWQEEYKKLKKLGQKNPSAPPNIPQISPALLQEFLGESAKSESETDESTTSENEKRSPDLLSEKDIFQIPDPQSDVEANIKIPSAGVINDMPVREDSFQKEQKTGDTAQSVPWQESGINDESLKSENLNRPSLPDRTSGSAAQTSDVSASTVVSTVKSEDHEMLSTANATLNQRILQQQHKSQRELFQRFFQKSQLPGNRALWFFLRTPTGEPCRCASFDNGGHFLWNRGSGTIIDPGFGFLDQFLKVGGSLAEVQNIVITQDNESHLAQFETIRRLLLQGGFAPNVCFYLNLGAVQKLSSMIDMNDKSFSQGYLTLYTGADYELLGGGKLKVLPAYRQESKSVDHAVGLSISLSSDNTAQSMESSESVKKIVYTSDTGLFPLTLSYDSTKNRIVHISDKNQVNRILSRRYLDEGAANADLMVLHIGSLNIQFDKSSLNDAGSNVKINEMDHIDLSNRPVDTQLVELCSVGQLGFLGVREIIVTCAPKFAAVCGWAKEMIPMRLEICELLQEQCNIIGSENAKPVSKIVPEDFSLVYNIFDDTIFDCVNYDWVPTEKTIFQVMANVIYFFSEEKRREFESVPDYYAQRFLADLKYKKKSYFIPAD